MLVKRDAFNLANSLSSLTGRATSHIVFGIGVVGMLLNFALTIVVSRFTAPPPERVQRLVEEIRLPGEAVS